MPCPKKREWGFIRDGKWVRYDEYLEDKYGN